MCCHQFVAALRQFSIWSRKVWEFPFSQIQTKLIIAHGNFNFKQGWYIGETYMFPPKKQIIVMESSNQSPAKMKGFHITEIPGPPNTFVKIWA